MCVFSSSYLQGIMGIDEDALSLQITKRALGQV
jgi:hypothetical protein